MTKTLYLTWHGATLFSTQGRCEGWSDSYLTEQACEEARHAAAFFATRGILPDALFSSMSERACDTLELISRELWGEVKGYHRLKGLKDVNYGIYEAKDTYLVPPEPYGSFLVKFDGESDEQVARRLDATLRELAGTLEGDTALVSTHRYACARLCAQWDADIAQKVSAASACSILTLAYDPQRDELTFVDLFDPRG